MVRSQHATTSQSAHARAPAWLRIGLLAGLLCGAAPSSVHGQRAPKPEIRYDDQRATLSADVTQMPLDALLRGLADAAGLILVLHGDATRAVTVRFRDLALKSAFRRALTGTSHVISTGSVDGNAWEVWIMGDAAAPVIARRPPPGRSPTQAPSAIDLLPEDAADMEEAMAAMLEAVQNQADTSAEELFPGLGQDFLERLEAEGVVPPGPVE